MVGVLCNREQLHACVSICVSIENTEVFIPIVREDPFSYVQDCGPSSSK